MTVSVRPEQVAEVLAAGMDAHVGKPLRADTLLDTIDRISSRAAATSCGASRTNPDVLGALTDTVGANEAGRMLAHMAEELVRRFGATTETDRAGLARDAHAMVTAAGGSGFLGLALACREVEDARPGGGGYAASRAVPREVDARMVADVAEGAAPTLRLATT